MKQTINDGKDADISSHEALYNRNTGRSWMEKRFALLRERQQRVEAPPFPIQINIETTNICNHRCSFCAIGKMRRPGRQMEPVLFNRLVAEAYELGAREVGLFSGAEPLTCKHLEEFILYCKKLGYEYLYISTNGVIGDATLFRRLIDAGLDSIKFSINGGDRQTYSAIHGRDDFDKAIETVRFVGQYARQLDRHVFVGVSSALTPETEETFVNLVRLIGDSVEEISKYECHNQSGQTTDLPPPPVSECENPFVKAHISLEGYMRACCNDYDNDLAIEDLNKMSLAEAWHSKKFRKFRRRHLRDDLKGTRCHNCLKGGAYSFVPLNTELAHRTDKN